MKPQQLAAFMLTQFPTADKARDWLLRRAWVMDQMGEVGRAWLYKQAVGHLAVVTS